MSIAIGNRNLDLLVAAAVDGERCPQDAPHGPLGRGAISELVRAGQIRSEVYSRNWRVVTILKGEHAGKSTAAPPWGGKPYRVDGELVERVATPNPRREISLGGGRR